MDLRQRIHTQLVQFQETTAYNTPSDDAFLDVYNGEFTTEFTSSSITRQLFPQDSKPSTEVRVLPESDQTLELVQVI